MAGSSKSYFRKDPGSWTTTPISKVITHPFDPSQTITITANLVEQFEFNPGTPTIDPSNGQCTSNTGDAEYFAQEGSGGVGGTCDGGVPGGGPEHNMGGAQINNEPFTSQAGYHECP